MPRSCVNFHQFKVESIGGYIRGKLFQKNKTVTELAEILGVTRQGMNYKLKENVITYSDLLSIIDFLELSDFEVLDLMRLRGA